MATSTIDEAHRVQQLKNDDYNTELEKSLLKVAAYMTERQHAEGEDRRGDDMSIFTAGVSARSAPTDHGLRDSIEESDDGLMPRPLGHKPSTKRKTSRDADSEDLSNKAWRGMDVIELSDDVSSELSETSPSRERENGGSMEHRLRNDDSADQCMKNSEYPSRSRIVSSPPLRLSVTPDRTTHSPDHTQATSLHADFTGSQNTTHGIPYASSPFRASLTPEHFHSEPCWDQQSIVGGGEDDVVEADFNDDHPWQPASENPRQDSTFGQRAIDEQTIDQDDAYGERTSPSRADVGETSTLSVRGHDLPFDFVVLIPGETPVKMGKESLDVDMLEVLAKHKDEFEALINKFGPEWKEKASDSKVTCLWSRIKSGTSVHWTVEMPRSFACMTCVNAQRPCFYVEDEEIMLLSLPPTSTKECHETKKGHYVSERKGLAKRHRTLWGAKRG